MPATRIILLDIPSTIPGHTSTSPHTWKVRLALNYKRLAYETWWIETVDIAKTCISLGIGPTAKKPNGDPKYTLPAIIDNTSAVPVLLADSSPIIAYLERTYPDPDPSRSLIPEGTSALMSAFDHYLTANITMPVYPLMAMAMHSKKGPRDQLYLRERLAAMFSGKSIEEIEAKGQARETAWARIKDTFDGLAASLMKSGGEFYMGDRMSLADFALCGLLIMFRTASPDEAWVKISSWSNGRWARYLAAFEPLIVTK